MSELAKRAMGAAAKFATGTVTPSSTVTSLTISGLPFTPNKFMIFSAAFISSSTYDGVQAAFSACSRYWARVSKADGNGEFTAAFTTDGFTATAAVGFLSGNAYTWVAWKE